MNNKKTLTLSTVSVGVQRTDFWLKVSAFRVNQTKFGSETERVATLSFVLLDQNKNKVLERKEWKTFREMVMPAKWVESDVWYLNGGFLNEFRFFLFFFLEISENVAKRCPGTAMWITTRKSPYPSGLVVSKHITHRQLLWSLQNQPVSLINHFALIFHLFCCFKRRIVQA